MSRLLLSIIVLGGAGLLATGCAEEPEGSGCVYNLVNGELVAAPDAEGFELAEYGSEVCEWHIDLQSARYASTTAPPTESTAPAGSTPTEPTAPTGPTTTETTMPTDTAPTTTLAPAPFFSAIATCRIEPFGVVLTGTGTPGSTVQLRAFSPYDWHYATRTPSTITVSPNGAWSVTLVGQPAWFPFNVEAASSLGEVTQASLASC